MTEHRTRLNAAIKEGTLYLADGINVFGKIEIRYGDVLTYERDGKKLKVRI